MAGEGGVIQIMEQRGAVLREMATPMWSYMRALLEQGFERDEAMAMVVVLQKSMTGHHCVFCEFGAQGHEHDHNDDDDEEVDL